MGVWKGGAVCGRAVWWVCERVVLCLWMDGVVCVKGNQGSACVHRGM